MSTRREPRGGRGDPASPTDGTSVDETSGARALPTHDNRVVLSITPLLEMLSEPIVAFDLDGSCLYANPASERLLGASDEQLVGRSSPPKWVHPQHATLWTILFEWGRAPHSLSSEVLSTDLELVLASAPSVRARLTWDPVLGPDGSATCLLAMVRTLQDHTADEIDLRIATDPAATGSAGDPGRAVDRDPCSGSDLRDVLDDLRTLLDRMSGLDVGAVRRVEAFVGSTAPGASGAVVDEWRHRLGLLSDRENEVLSHLLDGKRIATTAQLMYLSEHTVRNHLKAVYRKLGLHSVGELRELLTPAGRILHMTPAPSTAPVPAEREPEPLAR